MVKPVSKIVQMCKTLIQIPEYLKLNAHALIIFFGILKCQYVPRIAPRLKMRIKMVILGSPPLHVLARMASFGTHK